MAQVCRMIAQALPFLLLHLIMLCGSKLRVLSYSLHQKAYTVSVLSGTWAPADKLWAWVALHESCLPLGWLLLLQPGFAQYAICSVKHSKARWGDAKRKKLIRVWGGMAPLPCQVEETPKAQQTERWAKQRFTMPYDPLLRSDLSLIWCAVGSLWGWGFSDRVWESFIKQTGLAQLHSAFLGRRIKWASYSNESRPWPGCIIAALNRLYVGCDMPAMWPDVWVKVHHWTLGLSDSVLTNSSDLWWKVRKVNSNVSKAALDCKPETIVAPHAGMPPSWARRPGSRPQELNFEDKEISLEIWRRKFLWFPMDVGGGWIGLSCAPLAPLLRLLAEMQVSRSNLILPSSDLKIRPPRARSSIYNYRLKAMKVVGAEQSCGLCAWKSQETMLQCVALF